MHTNDSDVNVCTETKWSYAGCRFLFFCLGQQISMLDLRLWVKASRSLARFSSQAVFSNKKWDIFQNITYFTVRKKIFPRAACFDVYQVNLRWILTIQIIGIDTSAVQCYDYDMLIYSSAFDAIDFICGRKISDAILSLRAAQSKPPEWK